MEDIDPPREQPGAADGILRTLEAYGLHWDEPVVYQSQRAEAYRDTLHLFETQGLSYKCTCTRKQVKQMGGQYNRHCFESPPEKDQIGAIRFVNSQPVNSYQDVLLGKIEVDPKWAGEDFIIHRKDGLFAYQLAVVTDDIAQGITQIVRGQDLLEPSVHQLALYKSLNADAPELLHLPLIIQQDGRKLSKQNQATPIDTHAPQASLITALSVLGQTTCDYQLNDAPAHILEQAVKSWDLNAVPKQAILSP